MGFGLGTRGIIWHVKVHGWHGVAKARVGEHQAIHTSVGCGGGIGGGTTPGDGHHGDAVTGARGINGDGDHGTRRGEHRVCQSTRTSADDIDACRGVSTSGIGDLNAGQCAIGANGSARRGAATITDNFNRDIRGG